MYRLRTKSLGLSLLVALTTIALVAPVHAKTMRLRLQPGLEWPAGAAPIAVAEVIEPRPAVTGTPSRPQETDAGMPPSERAAAAAARAKQALADEDGGFDSAGVATSELIGPADAPAAAPIGQPIEASSQRRSMADVGKPPVTENSKPSVTCIAGCY